MTTSNEGRTANAITLNHDQKLYVIPCGQGFNCLGFDNARGHARQIADRLGRGELAFADGEYGTLNGYAMLGISAPSRPGPHRHCPGRPTSTPAPRPKPLVCSRPAASPATAFA